MVIDEDAPMTLSGAGLSGVRLDVSPAEAAKRRTTMATLLANGLSDEEIVEMMKKAHTTMIDDEVTELQEKVAERMLAESEKRKPYKKALAEKRLQRHIVSAASRNAWGAVANLEGQLARIQGTEEPQESKLTVDARLQSAAVHVLGAMSNEQLNELVAEELKRLPKSV